MRAPNESLTNLDLLITEKKEIKKAEGGAKLVSTAK